MVGLNVPSIVWLGIIGPMTDIVRTSIACITADVVGGQIIMHESDLCYSELLNATPNDREALYVSLIENNKMAIIHSKSLSSVLLQ